MQCDKYEVRESVSIFKLSRQTLCKDDRIPLDKNFCDLCEKIKVSKCTDIYLVDWAVQIFSECLKTYIGGGDQIIFGGTALSLFNRRNG